MFSLEPPSELADLGINTSCESNLGLLSSLGSLSCPHTLVLDVDSEMLDLLDDVVVQRVNRSLERDVS